MQTTEAGNALWCWRPTGARCDPGRPGPHYCRAVGRLSYLRRDELDHSGQEVWDSIVGSRGGAALVNDQGALTGPSMRSPP